MDSQSRIPGSIVTFFSQKTAVASRSTSSFLMLLVSCRDSFFGNGCVF